MVYVRRKHVFWSFRKVADRRWWRLARIACINRPIVFSTVHSHILPDLHYLYDVSSQVPSKTVAKPIENLRTRHVLPDDTKFNEAADNTPNPEIFDPAADLDTFRNVDPTRFESPMKYKRVRWHVDSWRLRLVGRPVLRLGLKILLVRQNTPLPKFVSFMICVNNTHI